MTVILVHMSELGKISQEHMSHISFVTLSNTHAINPISCVLDDIVCARFLHSCCLCASLFVTIETMRGHDQEEKFQGYLCTLLISLPHFRGGFLSSVI